MDGDLSIDVARSDDDFAALAEVANAVWPRDPRTVPELREVETVMRVSLTLVARTADAPVGSAFVATTRDGDSTSRICVLPSARRRGIARALKLAQIR